MIRLAWGEGPDGSLIGYHNDVHVATLRPIKDESARDHWKKEYTWEVIGGARGQTSSVRNGKRACRKWYTKMIEEAGL